MKKSVELIGLPVISITEGTELGKVKSLVLDAAKGAATALVIDDGKWYLGAKFLPFSAVIGLGENAITTEASNALVTIADVPDLERLLCADIKVIGTKVLTKTTGRMEGNVTEFTLDDAGTIVACEYEDNDGTIAEVPAERIVTFGKEVLIISASADVVKTEKAAPAAPVQAKAVPAPKEEKVTAPVAAEPAPAVEAPVEKEKEEAAPDESAKKFDEKHRKYLLGKKASRRIETDNGLLIVEQGGEITEEVLQKAKLAGKFVELSMNIQ